jgi:PhnB protein
VHDDQEFAMAFRPYLTFAGNAREAFTKYQEVFGGELVLLDFDSAGADAGPPPAGMKPDAIMHGALMTSDGGLLMGADDMGGNYKGTVDGVCVNVNLADPGEVKRVFNALAEGGSVHQEVTETFFSPAFGICQDRWGVQWMIMVEQPMP